MSGGQPWISYLTIEEIEEGLARPDKEDPDMDNWVADARDDLRVWLETAREPRDGSRRFWRLTGRASATRAASGHAERVSW